MNTSALFFLCIGCLCLFDSTLCKTQQLTGGNEDNEDKEMRLMRVEITSLSKTNNLPRDKRALGIILRGFMEALGYTVSPIQIAALPAVTQTVTASNNNSVGPSSLEPRQRETLRFTGVLNFGNKFNATSLVDDLARYEKLFHGNNVTNSSTPMTKSEFNSTPEEPYFVPIPLPISPNLQSNEDYNNDDANNKDYSHNDNRKPCYKAKSRESSEKINENEEVEENSQSKEENENGEENEEIEESEKSLIEDSGSSSLEEEQEEKEEEKNNNDDDDDDDGSVRPDDYEKKKSPYKYKKVTSKDDEKNNDAIYTLRDSYGVSLEKPNGKISERLAGYISMFKNSKTGIYYDPKRRITKGDGLYNSADSIKYQDYEIEPKKYYYNSYNNDDEKNANQNRNIITSLTSYNTKPLTRSLIQEVPSDHYSALVPRGFLKQQPADVEKVG